MKQAPLNATLTIEIRDHNVYANLEFHNLSQSMLLVDKYKLALDGKLTTRAFIITYEDEKKLPYKGLLIKRKEDPDNYVEIAAGDSISTTVKLNDYYEFSQKPQKYKVRFFAFDPFSGLDEMYEINSNSVEINFP